MGDHRGTGSHPPIWQRHQLKNLSVNRACGRPVSAIGRQPGGVGWRERSRPERAAKANRFEAGALRRSLGWAEKTWGPDHWRVARVRLALAQHHVSQDDPRSAEHEARRALAALEPEGEEPRPELVDALRMLGVALRDQRRIDDARSHYERALVIARSLHGDEHPIVARCVRDLAGLDDRD